MHNKSVYDKIKEMKENIKNKEIYEIKGDINDYFKIQRTVMAWFLENSEPKELRKQI